MNRAQRRFLRYQSRSYVLETARRFREGTLKGAAPSFRAIQGLIGVHPTVVERFIQEARNERSA